MSDKESSRLNEVVTLEDDTEDGPKAIPKPITQTMQLFPMASGTRAQPPSSSSQVWQGQMREEELELRLGPRGNKQPRTASVRTQGNNAMLEPRQKGRDLQLGLGGASSRKQVPPELEEIKLKCIICWDYMKRETSTLCGHLFCWDCIVRAIWMQGRCPSCHMPLKRSSIHRIFLPSRA